MKYRSDGWMFELFIDAQPQKDINYSVLKTKKYYFTLWTCLEKTKEIQDWQDQ